MGRTLVIAEKPSLGRAIAEAVGARERRGSALVGRSHVVTWAHGHVVDLKAPDEYAGRGWDGAWSASALPMLPDPFELKVSGEAGAAELFSEISALIASDDVDSVVHAGDPDREGEGIVRRILALAGNGKPVRRLWCSSMEPSALREALGRARPDAEYDGLADAAEGRAKADWLVGMNATRALTCAYGRTVQAGRVMTALLRIVADRTRANAGFKSVPFWQVRVEAAGVTLETGRYAARAEADAAMAAMAASPITVRRVERKASRAKPPALYSLTDMQRDASRYLKMTPERSLAAAQALYEAGLQTYPRTESRAIPESDLASVEALLAKGEVAWICGDAAAAARARSPLPASALVDDAAVSGHPALLPTPSLTRAAHAALPEDQRLVSLLVCARLMCALTGEPLVRETTAVEAECAGIPLSCKVTRTLGEGWTAVRAAALGLERKPGPPEVPSPVAEGAVLPQGAAEVHEGETAPPPLFTDETLLAAMENADRLVEDESLKGALASTGTRSGGIGTPATRTPAIAKLMAIGYTERAKGKVRATDLGLWVDSLAPEVLTKPDLTASWERDLDRVESGEMGLAAFEGSMRGLAAKIVAEVAEGFDPAKVRTPGPEPLGRCPRCGEPMVLSRSGRMVRCTSARFERADDGSVACVDGGCGFRFMREVCGKRLTEPQLKALLSSGSVAVSGLKSKKGSTFRARIVLDEGSRWGTRLEFDGARAGRRGARGAGR